MVKSILIKAKHDEKSAPKMYNKLIVKLKSNRDKNIVRGIIKQERRHLKKLKTIRSYQ